ncbi:MAG: DUF454 domain-containing protein [Alphaproteobacteria bacterium]|nr:DUF454 domain-containing protein [Alphaproteobacteria bacterium]
MTNSGTDPVRRPSKWKRAALLSLGWIFVLLGIAGLFLPILQGILFLLVGVYFLSLGSARARLVRQRVRRWLRQRYPERFARFETLEKQAMDWIRRRLAPLKARFGRARKRGTE